MVEVDESPTPDSGNLVATNHQNTRQRARAEKEAIVKKLAANRQAALYQSPTADIAAMLGEIERGHEVDLEFPS